LAQLRRISETAVTSKEKKRAGHLWGEMFRHQYGDERVHCILKSLREVCNEYYGDRVLIGEDEDVAYLGNGSDELDMVFNFPLMAIEKTLTPSWIRKNQSKSLNALKEISSTSWAANTLGNHDRSRVFSRYGDCIHDIEYARLSIALMLTLRGTPFLHYGEEIGMQDLIDITPDSLRDTMATWYFQSLVEDLGIDAAEAAQRAALMTRDKNRTPMQWNHEPNAGFCPANVRPWLPIHPNYSEGINVADQLVDQYSLLNCYRRLITLRKDFTVLADGEYETIYPRNKDFIAFFRKNQQQTIFVLLNYSNQFQTISLRRYGYRSTQILLPQNPATIQDSLGKTIIEPYGIFISLVKRVE
jgi:alpha-glucosidase